MHFKTSDKEELKIAIIELLKTDIEFGQEVARLLFSTQGTKLVTWDSSTYIIPPQNKGDFFYEMQSKDRQKKHQSLREKYRKNKGIRLDVIQALQDEFEDAPSADEMIHLLRK